MLTTTVLNEWMNAISDHINLLTHISATDIKMTEKQTPNSFQRVVFEPRHVKTNKMACAPSEDSDQPGHPRSLIRVFAVRMKKPWVLSYPVSAQRRLWSDWADAQADLSLRWAHMPFCWFCHVLSCHFVGFVMVYYKLTLRAFGSGEPKTQTGRKQSKTFNCLDISLPRTDLQCFISVHCTMEPNKTKKKKKKTALCTLIILQHQDNEWMNEWMNKWTNRNSQSTRMLSIHPSIHPVSQSVSQSVSQFRQFLHYFRIFRDRPTFSTM